MGTSGNASQRRPFSDGEDSFPAAFNIKINEKRSTMNKRFAFLLATVFSLLLSSISHATIVGPVNVLSQINNGTKPGACAGVDVNVNTGGVAEMALDLDQDNVADICFGSISNVCTAGFNYDAFTLNTTLMMTTGTQIMNGTNATLAFWNGQAVGPFQGASGAINSANIGVQGSPMVFGFKGGSNTPVTGIGYFSFTVNADCSINFGSVDIATGANTFSNAVAAIVAAAPVPTVSEWGMILLIGVMAMFGMWQVRRRQGN